MVADLVPVDDNQQSERPHTLVRRRFLTLAGGTLFALATKLFVPAQVSAACPSGCDCTGTNGTCPCCSGADCPCCSGPYCFCRRIQNQCSWTFSTPAGNGCYHVYRCRDYHDPNGGYCVCKGYLGVLCPSRIEELPAV
jgi:hypothetical protein